MNTNHEEDDTSTRLADDMITRADADNLPDDHPLRTTAAKFEEAAQGYLVSVPPICTVGKFMGCWARARKAWCEYTGQPLI